MSNLLADPSLWTISRTNGTTPVLSTPVWFDEVDYAGYDFVRGGYYNDFAITAPAQPGKLKGSFSTKEFGLPGEPSYLVVLRTSDAWSPTEGPPTLDNEEVLDIYYQEQDSYHELDLVIEDTTGYIWIGMWSGPTGGIDMNAGISYILLFADNVDPDPEPDTPKNTNYVYEMEKGWSFDGAYIPHFLELNWLFQEDPFTYTSVQKVRVHGLAKGKTQLNVSMAGMQPDPIADYKSDYSEPQWLDLPYTPMHVSSDFVPVTHYVDYSDRGLALQMKFEGRNKDLTKPEPAHVLQVLALQGTPQGNGARSN